MELRAVVWAWETVIARLQDEVPALGRTLGRSCRPLAAERQLDGRLLLVIGSWWPDDLKALSEPMAREELEIAVGDMLEDLLVCEVVPWPAGMARAPGPDPSLVPAPDLQEGLTLDQRMDAGRCESPLQRWFFAHAVRRGLPLQVQYVVGHLRLDFAVPRYRVAAEVGGWETRRGSREREQQLGAERWRMLWFAGREVHENVDRCVSALLRALPPQAVNGAGRGNPSAPRPYPQDRRWR